MGNKKKKSNAGRRLKITRKLIEEAGHLVEQGNYTTIVCQYLGIHQSTWYRWLQDGEHMERGLQREFYDTIKKAEAYSEMRNVEVIQEAGLGNWTASAWYLERKFPDRWGRKDHLKADLEHTGEMNMNHTLSNMTDEELMALSKKFDIDE